jgi:hypothetical protein
VDLDPAVGSPLVLPFNPSRPLPYSPLVAAAPPLPYSPLWPPPSLSLPLLLPQVIAAPPLNPSRPPPPLYGAASPLGTPTCGYESSIGVWREEEGRKEGGKEEPKVILRSFFLVFVLRSN